MKYNKLYSFIGILIASLVNASRSDFFGDNDIRPKLFKILDDRIGTIKINLDDTIWATMKKKTELEPWDAQLQGEKYGTNNATLEFFVNDTEYKVKLKSGQFTFQLGGRGSRNFVKPGYNIKLEKGSIYDVKTLRLRSTTRDPTLMREKLSSDIINRIGLPVTSTNYVNVEVNGENLGLYVLTDKIRKDTIKKYFSDKKTVNLYECKDDQSRFEDNSIVEKCKNTDDKLIEKKEDLQRFVDAINQAKSIDDIKKVLDIDSFLRSIAFEFISFSWDHFLGLSHNYFWYKKLDGKWMMILNDFDETWGIDYSTFVFQMDNPYADKKYIPSQDEINIPNISLRDIDMGHKIFKFLIYDDDSHFRKILSEIMKEFFNPEILFPRIDEIADLIRDDLTISRMVDEKTGHAKGCFNILGLDPHWNMTHFEDGINYYNWSSNESFTYAYGLKFFIEERIRYICHSYGINPKTYELIEPRPKVSFWGIKNKYKATFQGNNFYTDPFVKYYYPNIDKEDYMQDSYNADPEKNNKPTNYEIPPFKYELE